MNTKHFQFSQRNYLLEESLDHKLKRIHEENRKKKNSDSSQNSETQRYQLDQLFR